MPERSVESVRNERLRLVDWRFLLAAPRPRRVLCRTDGPLAEALAEIAEEVVTTSARAECDLAVAVEPDESTLRELKAALAPGGACYTEWRQGPRAVEKMLRSVGFDEIGCYRRWPRSARLPLFWIPVGASGAEGYVRERARHRGGRARRLASELAGRSRDLVRGRIAGAISALAWCRNEVPDASDGPAAWLRSEWPRWGLGEPPEHLSILLATGGPRTVSKVVLLAFAEPVAVPLAAIKAPRVEEAAAAIRREAAALGRMGPRRLPGVPRLLQQREAGSVPVVIESAVPGRPLEGLLEAGNLSAWSTTATDWLARLGNGAALRPAAHWREAIVEPALAGFEQTFGEVVDPALLRHGQDLARSIGDLPSVPEQRDFGPWNVLVAPDGGLAVLDWESAEVDGLPGLDLLYFLAYASFTADRAWDRERRVASFTRSLDPSSATGALRRACLARYAQAVGVDATCLAGLRALVWLIHTQSDFRHAAADAGGRPSADALRQSFFLALWSAEIRDLRRSR